MVNKKYIYNIMRWQHGLTVILLILTSCFGGGSSVRKAKGFHYKLPSPWKTTDTEGSDQAFRLPSGAIATLSSSCDRNTDAPLEVLTRHLFFDLKKVEVVDQSSFDAKGQVGLFTVVKAKYDKTSIELNTFVTVKESCIYDFTLSSKKPLKPSEVAEFKNFITDFNYGE